MASVSRWPALPAARRVALVASLAVLAMAGCRGMPSTQPPIHPQLNMDFQKRLQPQQAWDQFPDGRAMRQPVEGTVARGTLHADDLYDRGMVGGEYTRELPPQVVLDQALLMRGKQRFEIYCMPCHDAAGTGHGSVVERGMLPPPSFHDPRVQAFPVGQVFDVISNGVRNMPAYGPQVPIDDRWAIATYVRALQRSHAAGLAAVPTDIRSAMGWSAPAGSQEMPQ